MKFAIQSIAVSALLWGSGACFAQNAVLAEPRNVVQLSAAGTVDVQQDWLVLTLATNQEGTEAAATQAQLRQALESALAETRRHAQPGQLEVRTGSFGLYPRYGKDGKTNGWQGRAELVLEGRDFARITATAGKIQTLAISQLALTLSREARAKVEGEAQTLAIEQFKARAAELARGFGFSGYSLREVAVTSNDGMVARPRVMAMEIRSASSGEAPVPVEAGKAQVVVTVSGSVQMR
ncbi:MAG: SIMPL domain-containing protein [Burkholderiaceae bacterium]|nr:SIMPL domain-containing protein [Burkholderiaceae bacterium]